MSNFVFACKNNIIISLSSPNLSPLLLGEKNGMVWMLGEKTFAQMVCYPTLPLKREKVWKSRQPLRSLLHFRDYVAFSWIILSLLPFFHCLFKCATFPGALRKGFGLGGIINTVNVVSLSPSPHPSLSVAKIKFYFKEKTDWKGFIPLYLIFLRESGAFKEWPIS